MGTDGAGADEEDDTVAVGLLDEKSSQEFVLSYNSIVNIQCLKCCLQAVFIITSQRSNYKYQDHLCW